MRQTQRNITKKIQSHENDNFKNTGNHCIFTHWKRHHCPASILMALGAAYGGRKVYKAFKKQEELES